MNRFKQRRGVKITEYVLKSPTFTLCTFTINTNPYYMNPSEANCPIQKWALFSSFTLYRNYEETSIVKAVYSIFNST